MRWGRGVGSIREVDGVPRAANLDVGYKREFEFDSPYKTVRTLPQRFATLRGLDLSRLASIFMSGAVAGTLRQVFSRA